MFSSNFVEGLKGSNGAGLDVVGSLLTAGVVVVIRGLLLVVGVVTSAVVLEGVTRATSLGLKTGASGRGAAVLGFPKTTIFVSERKNTTKQLLIL